MSQSRGTHILKLSCPDSVGIVAAVSGFISHEGCNIEDAQQFSDPLSGQFFMRVALTIAPDHERVFSSKFKAIAEPFSMVWQLHALNQKTRALLLVSKFDHCLNDLLYRASIGALPIEVVGVVSNHGDAEKLSHHYGHRFHHLPITPETRHAQEHQLFTLIEQQHVDLVVLARYMQILSPELSQKLYGRAINIHHSFLPSFKGARPYQQAYTRGVKLIGASAHYVTSDLDEGPIIEQDVARVDHAMTAEDFISIGRDIEAQVLARAVRLLAEHRIFLNGRRTVVFR